VSARHRKANRTRRYLYAILQHAHDLRASLRDAAGPEDAPLVCVTDDEVDKLARLADRADALAREVDALQSTIFARLLAHEAGGSS
jgi:hypothetical protein